MKRIVQRLSLAAAGLIALALVVPLAFEEEIGRRAVEAVEGQLRTPLSVEGASLSLLRDFPHVSVGLTGVYLGGYPADTLVVAGRLSGRVSYADLLFADTWRINSVEVSDARLRIARTVNRVGNWGILRPRADTSAAGGDFAFALEEIRLRGVEIDYDDRATDTRGRFRVETGALSGAFASTDYTLHGHLAGHSDYLELGATRYIEDVALGTDFELDIDVAENRYAFGPSTFSLDGMPVDLSGSIGFVKGSTAYNLRLATEEGSLGPLFRALPRAWLTPAIRQFESEGDFALSGTIAGLHDRRHAPAIDFEGRLRDGRLVVPALARTATDVSFALSYTNGDAHSMADSRLRLGGISAELDGQRLTGSLAWDNLDDPYYDIRAAGTLPLAWFDELWNEATLDGQLVIEGARLRGLQRHLASAAGARHVRAEGTARLRDVRVDYLGEGFDVSAERLTLGDAGLAVDGGRVEGLGNTLRVDVDLGRLVPYLFGDATTALDVRGAVATDILDLDRWVGLFNEGEAAGGAPAGTAAKGGAVVRDNPPLVSGFAARLNLSADRVRYGDVDGRGFSGSCTLDGSELELRGEAHAMEGHWEVDGTLDLRRRTTLAAKLACSEVNITELLEQTDNLGQDVVAARNLSGEMTARAYVTAAWDADGELPDDGLRVWANVGLTDGYLTDLEMLQALSKYVRSDDLRDIAFTDVEHWIEVEGGTVYLPAMFIQSSATNFTVAGRHSFAHDIDYAVRVNGAQVLLTKLFGKRPGIDILPDRRNGWMTGFKIEGTLVGDDYDVRMAGGDVRRAFRHSLSRKLAIRRKLTPLFGAERLIDDYDDEGVRRRDRPATRSRGTARAPVADRASDRPGDRPRLARSGPTRARVTGDAEARTAPSVTDDGYLAGFGDDGAGVDGERDGGERDLDVRPALSGAHAAALATPTPTPADGAANAAADRTVGVDPVRRPALSQPRAPTRGRPRVSPGEYRRPGATIEEDEVMEGFDEIDIPDGG